MAQPDAFRAAREISSHELQVVSHGAANAAHERDSAHSIEVGGVLATPSNHGFAVEDPRLFGIAREKAPQLLQNAPSCAVRADSGVRDASVQVHHLHSFVLAAADGELFLRKTTMPPLFVLEELQVHLNGVVPAVRCIAIFLAAEAAIDVPHCQGEGKPRNARSRGTQGRV